MRQRKWTTKVARRLSNRLRVGSTIAGAGLLLLAAGCSSEPTETSRSVAQELETVPSTSYEFVAHVPQGTTRALLSASNRLTLNGTGTVGLQGHIADVAGYGSTGTLQIQASSQIHANVFSANDIQLNSQSVIHGSAQSGGKITTQEPTQIIGSRVINSVPQSAQITWNVDWPDQAGRPVERNAAGTMPQAGDPGEALDPGNYGSFKVHARNRFTFRSGSYFFTSFNLDADAEIRIDSSNGPVQIYVRDSAEVQGLILPAQDGSGQATVPEGEVLLGYRGTGQLRLTGGFIGTVVAPHAEILLAAPRNNGQHRGSFYGKDVTNDSNSNLPLIPLDIDLSSLTSAPTNGGTNGSSTPCADVDGDGVCSPDDECPRDPAKTERGYCDCHVSDVDTDGDGVPDCRDSHSTDASSVIDSSGICDDAPAGTECVSNRCSDTLATCQDNSCGSCPPADNCFYKDFAGRDGDMTYWFCPDPVDWATAEAACNEQDNRTLVIPNEELEQNWLTDIADFDAWTGLNRSSDNWYTAYRQNRNALLVWLGNLTGTPYQGHFEAWAEGHPATGDRGYLSDDGEWVSDSATSQHGFICEQRITGSDDAPDNTPLLDGSVEECVDSPFPGGEFLSLEWTGEGEAPNDHIVPAAERIAFQDAVEECETCPEEDSPCAELCPGVLSVPTGDSCTKEADENELRCNFLEGWTPGPIAGLTNCRGSNNKADQSKCTATGDICGRVMDSSTNRNVFVCGPPDKYCAHGFNQLPEPALCDETVLCNPEIEELTVTRDDLLEGPSSNLTPLEDITPESIVGPAPVVDNTVLVPGFKPHGCGTDADEEADCNKGFAHPWCNADATAPDSNVTDPPEAKVLDDKQGETPRGQVVEFDFDPDLTLNYKANPGLYGDIDLDIEASISLSASVEVNGFLGYSTGDPLSILDAYAGGVLSRCEGGIDAYLKLLGHDFLPSILSEKNAARLEELGVVEFDWCTEALDDYMEVLGKAKKAYRDAQEVARQYQRGLNNNMEFPADFCSQLIQSKTPEGFPELDCAKATPNDVVNAFIGYAEYVLLNELAAKSPYLDTFEVPELDDLEVPDPSLPTAPELPEVDPGQLQAKLVMDEGGRDSQLLVSVPFAIGPIPMNFSVDIFYAYGVEGSLGFEFNPAAAMAVLQNTDANKLAWAYAGVEPYAEAGLDLFLGAGFDFGPVSAKIGISGELMLGKVSVPGKATAFIEMQAVDDERELDETAKALLAVGEEAGVIFPPNGKSAFKVYAGYDMNLDVAVTNILNGKLFAKLKIKFLFFSKSWKKQIVAFQGLPKADFPLIPHITDRGEIGMVRMPFTFQNLARYPDPPPVPTLEGMGGAGAVQEIETFTFDKGRVENLFYKEQCEPPVVEKCPTIFGTEGYLLPRFENTGDPVAYGTTGMDLHDRVTLVDGSGSADAAVRNGHVVLRNDVSLDTLWSRGTTDIWHRVSYENVYTNDIGSYIPLPVIVPELVLEAPTAPSNYSESGTVRVYSGQTKELAAGSRYDEVIVYGGAVLVLNGQALAGDTRQEFFFNTLRVEPGGIVRINHADGAVEVVIRDTFDWKGKIENGTGAANQHVFGVYGTGLTSMQSTFGFDGTVVVPNGTLELNSTDYTGAFYGKYLEVHQGAELSLDPCDI